MKDSSSSSIRLGGAVISDRIVSALLEELRTTRPDMLDGIWQEERPLAFDSTGHLDISWPGA